VWCQRDHTDSAGFLRKCHEISRREKQAADDSVALCREKSAIDKLREQEQQDNLRALDNNQRADSFFRRLLMFSRKIQPSEQV
jgi:hypothetical protein